ncbi:MAG: hypothetical protein ABL997_05090 [Planctomycetota bacterium]
MPAPRRLLLSLLPLLASCSAFTTMTSPVGGFAEQRPLPVLGTNLFDWKGMVHCHSYLSHDSKGTFEEIQAACERARTDFVVMTDHQTDASVAEGRRGMLGNTLFLVGCELRTPQGTVIAFPLTRPLRRWMHCAAMVQEAARQGAILLVCHAEMWEDWNVPGLVGAEIVNLHAGAMTANPAYVLGSGLLLPSRFLMENIAIRDPKVFAAWDEQLQLRHPFAPVGGGDAHASIKVLGPLGGTIADYPEVFLTISTHVLARTLDEASIVEAVKLGRTYVSFDVFHEGTGFDFRATQGALVHLPGATVAAAPELTLSVRTPTMGRIELLRDGVVVQQSLDDTLELRAPSEGVYRVVVYTALGSPWLFSSSIKVTAE